VTRAPAGVSPERPDTATAGDRLPEMRTEVPGPRSRSLAERLARVECPEVTCLTPVPVFFDSARGANVTDVDGNRFVDLLAGFGVAALGYTHPRVVAATAGQAERLPHTMGDVYPAALKVELLEQLKALLPGSLSFGILSSSGSDAIESALKTVLCATGRADVVAFEGAYHGLGFGALDATHRSEFRAPFASRLAGRTHFVPYGDAEATQRALRRTGAGAILVEPIQGRGGLRIPPPGFLGELRRVADAEGALLIADEIYTGLGRTGYWLGCEHERVEPDVVAIGKALGGGFPVSVCLGRESVMRSWPASRGEAVHTSTHLGNPLGCAAALAVLEVLEAQALPARAHALGERLLERLRARLEGGRGVVEVRGRGLLVGIELADPAHARRVVMDALRIGWILLAEGPRSDVLALTPPLTIDESVLLEGAERIADLVLA